MALNVRYRMPRCTRAQLDAAASANTILQGQAYLITDENRIAVGLSANTYEVFAKSSEASGGGGGVDPWTRIKLTTDFVNGTTTFNTITGMSFTPAANTDWLLEAFLLLQTPATANLPRLGLNVAAGQQYGSAMIEYPTSGTAKSTTNGWWTTGLANIQMAVGTAPVAGQPYLGYLWATGRQGATPGAINIQLAAETAAANAAIAKAGSHMRWMTVP